MLGTWLMALLGESVLFHPVFVEVKAWSLTARLLMVWTSTFMHIRAECVSYSEYL